MHAVLCALVLLFSLLPLYLNPVAVIAVVAILAVIVSAEFLGPLHGMITGAFFGLVSFVGSFIQPTLLSFAFHNPLISVVPRILIALSAYFASKGFMKISAKIPKPIAYGIGAAAGVITNTLLVLGLCYAFYPNKQLDPSTGTAMNWVFLSGIIVTNFILEFVVCVIVAPPIVAALKHVMKGQAAMTNDKMTK